MNRILTDTSSCIGWLKQWISTKKNLDIDEIHYETEFSFYGLDSVDSAELAGILADIINYKIEPTILFNYPTINKLAEYLAAIIFSTNLKNFKYSYNNLSCNKESTSKNIGNTRLNKQTAEQSVAIIGMACRFPKANSLNEFWNNLLNASDAITAPPKGHSHYNSEFKGGFIANSAFFANEFFNISPREAKCIDPQQRLLLEVSFHALEDAGITKKELEGSNTGVFIGISSKEYEKLQENDSDIYAATGNALSIAANRLSYFYDLKGPSLAVDTACSSSLMAVHLACNSLINFETNLAFAGGANLLLSLKNTQKFAAMSFLSADSRCKAFDKAANGYVRSEGVGVVILKRLADALHDGDRIYAIIKATASNQDGRTNGITAPNQGSQENLLQQIYHQAGIAYNTVNYVECHGTGTTLGDPIEVGALNAILGQDRTITNICRIGSVKTNIGHLEAAAGIAGLIKVALMLYHKKYVPNLHFNNPNPIIDFNNIPFVVQQQVEEFESGVICGINSFGFGGTNVHAVLTDSHQTKSLDISNNTLPNYQVLTISANSKQELALQKLAYQHYLSVSKNFKQICSYLACRRQHFSYRTAILARNCEEAIAELNKIDTENFNRCIDKPKIAFVFNGQGSQWSGMAKDLLQHTIFRKWIMICDNVISEYVDFSILEILLADSNEEYLTQSKFIQPVLVAFQIALSQYLSYLGIIPNFVFGHSLGELAAAYNAKALSLEHVMLLTVHRGQVMDKITGQGQMLVVKAPNALVQEWVLDFNLDIAAINSYTDIVVAGVNNDIFAFSQKLDQLQIDYFNLPFNYAFHSKQLDALIPELEKRLAQFSASSSLLNMISTVTGEIIDTANLNAQYWSKQMRQPVKFLDAVQSVLNHDIDIIIEIGASSVLLSYIQEIIAKSNKKIKAISSIKKNSNSDFNFIELLANLYQLGCDINWNKLYARCWIDNLSYYQFQRHRYWCKPYSEDNLVGDNTMTADTKINILNKLTTIIGSIMQINPKTLDINKPFIELGADSIIVVNTVKKIQAEFATKIAIRRLFEDLQTIDKLADFIQTSVSTSITQPKQLETVTAVNVFDANDNSVTQLFNQQLNIINQQLKILSGIDNFLDLPEKNNLMLCQLSDKPVIKQQSSNQTIAQTHSWQHRKIDITPVQYKFNSGQQQQMNELIAAYTQKTAKSKALVAKYRSILADSKASVGFRLSIKEMLYPIVGQSTDGSKLIDIDGNEYVDITMGFGVHLCGYKPKFIEEALLTQATNGLQLGPRSPIVGEVAELIAELTGLDRVAFSNTGTEAVITAIRIARAATGKAKIVLFKGSYHGHSDYALVEAYTHDDAGNPIPITPGIPANVLDNTLVLEYGELHELEKIRQYSAEIAAVLVEPVQSRRPDFQPIEFVKELRKLTTELDIALIFDEMITGFRAHPAGAQAIFGIKADMATYGKIVGGGLPIGIIAGSKRYMDHIDGGMWQYGDHSYPQVERTFFGGTFCQHPTSLATALATLMHMKQQGPQLQEKLNAKTAYLADQLNDFFKDEEVPIEVVYFSSLFKFKFTANFDLLFYYLILHGVYVWEWRNCFLSTAHSDEDIEKIIHAVKQSIFQMKKAGFL